MPLLNSDQEYGLVAKLFHWGLALYIFGMAVLGVYIANMQVSLASIHLFGWHKSMGVLFLGLITLRLFWRIFSPPPPILGNSVSVAQVRLAAWVHKLLYVCMFVLPATGWIASSASGFPMSFFGYAPIPVIAPVLPQIETVFFIVHGLTALLLVLLVFLHITGAFMRHYGKRDRTLRRMWF